MQVIGYVRCSSIEQAADGLSIQAQREKIATWCELSGADLVDVVEDAGVSGAKRLAERPGGSHIAQLLEARRSGVDAVVIVRLDRLGRDAAESLTYLRRFAEGPVGLVSISDRVDLSTPQGRAMAGVGAVFSQLERELIGQRTSEALQTLKRQRKPYGPTPFGFRVTDGLLCEDPAEQKVLKRIASRRKAGLSFNRIATELNGRGIPAKHGGPWYAMSVRSVVTTAGSVSA